MTDTGANPYTDEYFRGNARSATPSAQGVLPLLFDLFAPDAVVDVGCGAGSWLAIAESLGATVLRGYDGPWANPAEYTSANIDFVPVDLETSDVELVRRYDLAICLELAESLPAARGDAIVRTLCDASDVVLFSAATPGQGGPNHIHEMPVSYWAGKFRERGYDAFDVIRPAVWDNDDVGWWYRQNTLLYLRARSTVLDPTRLQTMARPLLDVVHPTMYRARTDDLRKRANRLRDERNSLAGDLRDAAGQIEQLRGQLAAMRPPRVPLRTRAQNVLDSIKR